MRARILIPLLLALSVALSGCRFAVVETGSVRVETPTAAPRAADEAPAQSVETKN